MANIDQYIEQIENARYGKDVRDAIVNALKAINTEHHDNNVTSFNSRTGDVLPVNGDYNINQISSQGGLDGQIPVANSNGGFTLRTMHGEIDTLGQLTDVNISSPSDGQVLKYDSTNEEWVNGNDTGGTTVVANPSGTASENLTQLQVGDSIYDVSSGTTDYSDLDNKPQINGITLSGNKTSSDLGLTMTVDSSLSSTSTNPVQNKEIYSKLNALVSKISTSSVGYEHKDTKLHYVGQSITIPSGYCAIICVHLTNMNVPNESVRLLGLGKSSSNVTLLDYIKAEIVQSFCWMKESGTYYLYAATSETANIYYKLEAICIKKSV